VRLLRTLACLREILAAGGAAVYLGLPSVQRAGGGTGRVMDTIGRFIATLHNLLGHDKAAAAMGVPAGDKRQCLICQYEQYPGPGDPACDASGIPVDHAQQRELKRQAVIRALAPRPHD
jgi:hypothetical protein